MGARVDHLLHQALLLPIDERSALLAALLDSLEGSDDASIDAAWRAEVRLRRDQLRTGRVATVPWDEAKARLLAL